MEKRAEQLAGPYSSYIEAQCVCEQVLERRRYQVVGDEHDQREWLHKAESSHYSCSISLIAIA